MNKTLKINLFYFQSLVHMLKQRKVLTEPEVRCHLKQLVEAVKYVHNQNIIHRDLKLGNMLLNDHMELKIADFGLATRIGYEGEKKMYVYTSRTNLEILMVSITMDKVSY